VRSGAFACAIAWLALAGLAEAQPAPLSAAQRRIAGAVPDGDAGSPDRSYVVSNEWAHRLFFGHLDGLGGAMVAVGADQAYTMAAAAGSELIWAVDYDPVIARTHRMYTALVAESETPEALLARFEADAEDESVRLIEARWGEDARSVVRVYRRYRRRLRAYLRNVRRYAHGRTWLNAPAWYAHVRALHAGGRVIARTADVAGPGTFEGIAEAARGLGVTVRVVYLSNLEMFVANRPQLVANMRGLPTDDRSLLLRTAYHPRLQSAPHDHWHYIVQPFADYLARLATGRYLYANSITEDLIRTGRGGDGSSVIDDSVPMRED